MAAVFGLLSAPAVAASEPATRPAHPQSTPATEAPSKLSPEDLATISGGQAVTVNTVSNLTQQELTATSSGNAVTAGVVNSGAVTFSPQALSGFNGIGNFVINTGANNTLQGAINISIATVPAP
jgi:hypothetical protein